MQHGSVSFTCFSVYMPKLVLYFSFICILLFFLCLFVCIGYVDCFLFCLFCLFLGCQIYPLSLLATLQISKCKTTSNQSKNCSKHQKIFAILLSTNCMHYSKYMYFADPPFLHSPVPHFLLQHQPHPPTS